ncbi:MULTISPECIES: hypothetical protein [Bradyrhizobium]|uniref:hypothetical protein n=1 Tax=Bradyrhizobium TaxID=374 RepID=UPI001144A0CF|nr:MULTISPECIES: hypothetical protein [Bradyrhizobium]QOG18163.1 hypothetical protein FOM02_13190 [Bradyrhizobium sp. SEMIA]UFW48524.1 hypothetical protein BaraCB756_40795 [Bradyrhizobium arachidis]
MRQTSCPFDEELAICQRYYEKSFAYVTAPASKLGTYNRLLRVLSGDGWRWLANVRLHRLETLEARAADPEFFSTRL